MTDDRRRTLHPDSPATYRIRVEGYLEGKETCWPEGVAVDATRRPGQVPQTTLVGRLASQAEQRGLLNHLLDQGLVLVEVECLAAERGAAHADP